MAVAVAISGTNVGSPVRPFTNQDNFPTAYADEILGGHHSVKDTTARNSIPAQRRKLGMSCRVTDDNKTYVLLTDAGNATTLDSDWGVDIPDATDVKLKDGSDVEANLAKIATAAANKVATFVILGDDLAVGENAIEQSVPVAGSLVYIAANVMNDTVLTKDVSIQVEQYNGSAWSVVGSAIIPVGTASKDITVPLTTPVPVKAMDRLRVNILSIQDGVKSMNVLVGIKSTI